MCYNLKKETCNCLLQIFYKGRKPKARRKGVDMIKKLLLKSAAYLFLAGIYLVCSNSSVCSADEQNVMEASIELHLAYSELNKGQIEEAIASFDKAISLDDKNALAYVGLGKAYSRKGDFEEAIASFDKAISLDDKNALAYVGLGYTYARKGDFEEAIASFDKAISLDDKNALAYVGLGNIYSRKGDFEEAIASFDKAISLDPQNAFSHYSLGLTYISLNENDLAIEQYNILKGLNKNLAEQLQNKIKLE
jgi:Tfp pilus assembly protein PilF